ncbi:putative DNA topoisomerase 1 [Paratrimastix pyriformis]|uniref:DNA topoisomerase 1 n=1 Tax=Paratrimastix pyriformis TaxID=342808 RepID=A0ABQ8U2E5_9EUKA|nr:putative DNA topoisomerase 1 [Paratrimastix pyriformis]
MGKEKAETPASTPKKAAKGATPKKQGEKADKKKKEIVIIPPIPDDVVRWWTDNGSGPTRKGDRRWETLEHNGVLFAPPYDAHHVKMKYDGEPIELNIEAEEIATYYAMCFERAPFKRQVFQDNFFADFRKALTPELRRQITDLTLCDFKPINDWWKASVAAKKAMPKEEKKKILEANKVLCAPYQFCMVDGHKQKVSNFRVEPPTLFQGRGEHPLAGKLKKRIRPEDVTINIGEEATVPKAPEGHRWAEVIHNHDVTWLAMWKDEIMNHHKYVMLAANSTFRGQSDFLKFEAARCLHVRPRRPAPSDWIRVAVWASGGAFFCSC